jgi:hypothetical protein
MHFINNDLRLKLVFDNLTICCDASVRSVVNTVREIEGIIMEFVQYRLGIAFYTNFKINILIANTYKIIAYSNVHRNETTGIMIQSLHGLPSPPSLL